MESKFTGRLIGLIGITLLQCLITGITFGIALPWALCIKQRWLSRNTFIDGRQTKFDGTGGQLFGNYIVWWLLSCVTFGIYSLWLPIKMQQWVASHTHFAD